MRYQAIVGALCCWFAVSVYGAASTATQRIHPLTATIGDRLTYRVMISHPTGFSPILGPLSELGPFRVTQMSQDTVTKNARTAVTSVTYHLVPFSTGQLSTPTRNIVLKSRTGRQQVVRLLPTSVSVTSVLPTDTNRLDIKPISEPVPLLVNWSKTAIIVGLVGAGLLGLAGLGWWWWRRRTLQPDIDSVQEPLRLFSVRDALAELEAKRLFEDGHYIRYYSELSDILKQFLSDHFSQSYFESTTSEVMSDLATRSLDPETMKRIHSLFALSDLVKFANIIPNEQHHSDSRRRALDIVERITS